MVLRHLRIQSILVEHCRRCKKCKESIFEQIKEIIYSNVKLEETKNFGCEEFRSNIMFYIEKLLDKNLATCVFSHALTCDTCNNLYVNSLGDYTKVFNISVRVDKV